MKTFIALAALLTMGGAAYAAPRETQQEQPKGSLSHKLNKSHGVIRPPTHVDPEMQVKPPPHGRSRMPVIKPPLKKNGRKIVPK